MIPLLAELEADERRAVDHRDRLHRRAMALRAAMTRLRVGEPERVVRARLISKGFVEFSDATAATAGTVTADEQDT